MEIAVLAAGVTTLSNKEVETAIQAFAFSMVGPHGGATTPTAILAAVIGNTEINLQKQDGYNTVTLIQSLSLRDLAEISATKLGVIKIETVGANSTVTFTLEVCNDGALALTDSTKLMFNLSGIPATTATTVDGLDHANLTPVYVNYESKFVNANVGKDFTIDQHYSIALPTANIKNLEFTYVNGKTVKYGKREILQLLQDEQDVLFAQDGKVFFGADKFCVISCEYVVTTRVTLDASTNFYLLKNQSI